ncbi:UDP-galactopyranose mutase [Agrobacterium rosae]|uniref:UDP-galactopyranose mutase n=1 Tax=Agrobacterium rosae TaxID=1972867 RepID=A0AAE5S0S3_9HYPH|nr:glycosyltransferase family 1 protein [Agrobacterium rosae]KAA3521389.1 glycosyltransferase family 1 protein [Agrobacterium rosae]MQB48284.1 glycosyltransferase family 1 protein [Agrobacterium rosae]POO53449.1 UDP-galactopyranose mutase [Agrobacterium rosae]
MNLSSSISSPLQTMTERKTPLICFSHLRWDFVLQRPQHLMGRFAKDRAIFFFEEFIPTDHHLPYLEIHPFEGTTVKSVRPRIPHWWNEADRELALSKLLDDLLAMYGAAPPILWFYTPAMFGFARHVEASAVVYDCMDELANFKFAPQSMKEMEAALIARADVVFTGGYSLYEAKCDQHDNIHAFPSGVDVAHFHAARKDRQEPADQMSIPGPKVGYYGVIDERLDLALIEAVAKARPQLSFVIIGPVAKIALEDLPRAANIHYLGQKNYSELPAYLSGWDAALMPFALNSSTQFISPTKTPEYLAAGRPVVSTAITDVIRHYGDVEGVFVAADAEGFATACDDALALRKSGRDWLVPVDAMLEGSSWDKTFLSMKALVDDAVLSNTYPAMTAAQPVTRKTSQSPVASRNDAVALSGL